MKEMTTRGFIGSMDHHRHGDDDWAVVHACKHPCHQEAVRYSGSLPKDHPHYLVFEQASDLFLNLIDPPVPLFQLQSFVAFRAFATREFDEGKNVLIHCNQGRSRAPALALLLMAKDLGVLPSDSFAEAASAFREKFPDFAPGRGIEVFLDREWTRL